MEDFFHSQLEQFFDVAQIAVPARGSLVPQQVFLADERHSSVAVASANHGGPRLGERHTRNPVEQVDPHGLHANGQDRSGLA